MKSSNGYVMSKGRVLFLLIAFTSSLVAAATSAAGKSNKNVRLPRTVLPRHYDVRLFPVLKKGNFTIPGRVSIDLECKEETDRIVLHSTDIDVDPKSVKVHLSLIKSNSRIATLTDGICLPGAGRIDQQVADGRRDTLRRGDGVPSRSSQLQTRNISSKHKAGQGKQLHAVDELHREPHRSAAGLVPFHLQRGRGR